MAIYRQVQIDFWTDSKVSDNFTPEDKYFMLFLLTNPATNMIGCYELSKKNMSYLLGYSIETINSLIDRFTRIHQIILYDNETKEVLVQNWHKFNWINSPKLLPKMMNDLAQVKSFHFQEIVAELLANFFKRDINLDTLSIPYPYPIDTLTHEENKNKNENKKENKNKRESKKSIKESGNGMSTISRPSPDSKPSLSDIIEFFKTKAINESQIDFTANKFFNYYEARGWLIDGQPIYDWKALINYWLEIKTTRVQNGYSNKTERFVPDWMNEFETLLEKGD